MTSRRRKFNRSGKPHYYPLGRNLLTGKTRWGCILWLDDGQVVSGSNYDPKTLHVNICRFMLNNQDLRVAR